MDASHASLRDDYEVSCPELDVAVEAARAAGALGAADDRRRVRRLGDRPGGASAVDEVALAVAAAFDEHGFAPPATLVADAAGAAGRTL